MCLLYLVAAIVHNAYRSQSSALRSIILFFFFFLQFHSQTLQFFHHLVNGHHAIANGLPQRGHAILHQVEHGGGSGGCESAVIVGIVVVVVGTHRCRIGVTELFQMQRGRGLELVAFGRLQLRQQAVQLLFLVLLLSLSLLWLNAILGFGFP